MWYQSDQHIQPQHFQHHHQGRTRNLLTVEFQFHPNSMVIRREERGLEQIRVEAKVTSWQQRPQTMQPSVKISIQTRNLEDIMVTTTPDLVFELVIFLNVFLIVLS